MGNQNSVNNSKNRKDLIDNVFGDNKYELNPILFEMYSYPNAQLCETKRDLISLANIYAHLEKRGITIEDLKRHSSKGRRVANRFEVAMDFKLEPGDNNRLHTGFEKTNVYSTTNSVDKVSGYTSENYIEGFGNNYIEKKNDYNKLPEDSRFVQIYGKIPPFSQTSSFICPEQFQYTSDNYYLNPAYL